MRWSLLLVGLEEDKQSTIALGYLMRNREESGIVASKWYGYGNLVGMFRLWLKKCKTWKIFRETIGSNSVETWKLVGYWR